MVKRLKKSSLFVFQLVNNDWNDKDRKDQTGNESVLLQRFTFEEFCLTISIF